MIETKNICKNLNDEVNKLTNENDNLKNDIANLEEEFNSIRIHLSDSRIGRKTPNERLADHQLQEIINGKEIELKDLRMKFEELIIEYRNTKEELEISHDKLLKVEDIIRNYKRIIESLTNEKDNLRLENEDNEAKMQHILGTLSVV